MVTNPFLPIFKMDDPTLNAEAFHRKVIDQRKKHEIYPESEPILVWENEHDALDAASL